MQINATEVQAWGQQYLLMMRHTALLLTAFTESGPGHRVRVAKSYLMGCIH